MLRQLQGLLNHSSFPDRAGRETCDMRQRDARVVDANGTFDGVPRFDSGPVKDPRDKHIVVAVGSVGPFMASVIRHDQRDCTVRSPEPIQFVQDASKARVGV